MKFRIQKADTKIINTDCYLVSKFRLVLYFLLADLTFLGDSFASFDGSL